MKEYFRSIPGLKVTKNSLQRIFPKLFIPSIEFYKWYNFIDDSQWWSQERLNEYSWKKMKEMLVFCHQNIPYYQKLFKKIDFSPSSNLLEKDFIKIPILTKELLRDHEEELLQTGVNKDKILKYNTGGSTGIPLIIFKEIIDDIIEDAFMTNQWARVGFKQKDCRVIIRGEVTKDHRLWEYQPSSNSWLFSAYHLSEAYIYQMVDKLNVIKPKFIHVYPSSLWVFANLMKEKKLKLKFTPIAILCGSEKLFDHQKKLFNEVFNCPSYSWLGLAEQTTLAGECECSTDLHIFPQHSYVELIDDSGKVISEPGITGHIVGSNLHRHTFPLIRYASGDMAQYAEGQCKCGRHYKRFKEVEGRIQNMIVSRDGRIIPLTALIFGQHLKAFNKVIQMQLEQWKAGEVEVKLVKGINFNDADSQELLKQLTDAAENTIIFSISFHDALERTISGKHKFMIQHLKIDYYNFTQS